MVRLLFGVVNVNFTLTNNWGYNMVRACMWGLGCQDFRNRESMVASNESRSHFARHNTANVCFRTGAEKREPHGPMHHLKLDQK